MSYSVRTFFDKAGSIVAGSENENDFKTGIGGYPIVGPDIFPNDAYWSPFVEEKKLARVGSRAIFKMKIICNYDHPNVTVDPNSYLVFTFSGGIQIPYIRSSDVLTDRNMF